MYYTTCPLCGANLDPGEHCDCAGEDTQQPQDTQQEVNENVQA